MVRRNVTEQELSHAQKGPPARRSHSATQRYEGKLHPTSKLRHGEGLYRYPNSFFTYQGEYQQGLKHGKGTLTCKDGRTIEGTF